MFNREVLKLIQNDGVESDLPLSRIDNDTVIYSKSIDSKLNVGDVIKKDWQDGQASLYKVLNFKIMNKLEKTLVINVQKIN
ncbi:hypothetical protein [Acinetobacter soli]|uniref:hypothetical protein n=1 Tax=Acinetobacter soli TaxID=487316 RepID=UPI00125F8056|nr:hypothetical protein [Acinetobacter soli]